MTMTTFSPPEDLPTGRRVYPALVIPFAETVDDAHEDAGRVFTWRDLKMPRRDVPVDVDHGQQTVGLASSFAHRANPRRGRRTPRRCSLTAYRWPRWVG